MIEKYNKSKATKLIIMQTEEKIDFADFLNEVVNYQEPEVSIASSPSFSPSLFIGPGEIREERLLSYTGHASTSPSARANKRPL